MDRYVVEMSYFDIKKLYDILVQLLSKYPLLSDDFTGLSGMTSQFYTILKNDASKLYLRQKHEDRYRVVIDKSEVKDLIFVCNDVFRNQLQYDDALLDSGRVQYCRSLSRVLGSVV